MAKKQRLKIAEQLRAFRASSGLNQTEMARVLRVPLRTYHGWERGEAEPRASVWEQIRAIAQEAR